MWRTQSGDRVFTKAEWSCLSGAVDTLRDWIESDIEAARDEPHSGIAAYDALTSEQKLLILTETCEALVLPDVPAPKHTAANEGTIAAIFAVLQTLIDGEVENDEGTTLRRALLAAIAGEPDLPSADCGSLGEWELLVERFANRVLWDSAYMLSGTFLDLPPGTAAAMNDQLGVDSEEYFVAIVREPAADELNMLSERLRRIVSRLD
jgi:hypothetical protein